LGVRGTQLVKYLTGESQPCILQKPVLVTFKVHASVTHEADGEEGGSRPVRRHGLRLAEPWTAVAPELSWWFLGLVRDLAAYVLEALLLPISPRTTG
jgi:hypothetical protein